MNTPAALIALGLLGVLALAAPPVVTPAEYCRAAGVPSDAVVLFDGSSLDNFTTTDGKLAPWKIEGGAAVIVPGSGSIISKYTFNDAQIHVEFREPSLPADKAGQDRGNSGVYLQGRYEIQVLDSFEHETYADGQCGAVYKQHAPLVNACRRPGEWQTYDIIFHAARFGADGKKTSDARVTVLHNGVLIQDHSAITGVTGSSHEAESANPGPLYLQEHGHEVAYRNIWVRAL